VGGLHSVTLVDSVRILATRADQPYAMAGSVVHLEVLAFDGRPRQPAPMIVYWVPLLCVNPADDAYFNCFSQFAGAGANASDGGASAEGGGSATPGLPPGLDLTPLLQTGPTFSFPMPANVVISRPGATPYGLVIVFNIACAGHVELVPLDPNNVQAPPIGCFDAQRNRLGPNDYVVGFTRIYSYPGITNANPVIDHVDVEGHTLSPDLGFDVPHCPSGQNCPGVHVGPAVSPTSQEAIPPEQNLSGTPLKEEIWADYYSTIGSFGSDARLLYDSKAGSLGPASDTDNTFQPPSTPGNGTIWIVVHDNRGGAAWESFSVHVK
jgi:hypothetical protein